MRLLYRSHDGSPRLKDVNQGEVPQYAILSHTWGPEEVTYNDIQKSRFRDKGGFAKIEFCLERAAADGLQYCWVDTCCINKKDGAEIQHAINSMFKWYKQARICYVYLSDVPDKRFEDSRWFQRGWTLQELIAPERVEFYSSEGCALGDKKSILKPISGITGVPANALQGVDLSTFGFDEIVAWSTYREAKYEEDIAYSLLGIFGVTMLLNYGEGREKAFHRLREEVQGSSIGVERLERLCTLSWNIPYPRDRDFIDRKMLSDQIQRKLQVPAARVALAGLGGVGKSQIAIEHCYRTREQSRSIWIFWVHTSNAARYEQSVRDIADLAQISGRKDPKANIYTLFRNWLRNEKNGNWMIVLDNADDADFLLRRDGSSPSLLECLPVCDHGTLLITTRDKHTARRLVSPNDIILVDQMDRDHALALLETKLTTRADQADSAALVTALEYMPLAITQAAAYINQMGRRCTMQQYIEKLHRSDQSKQSILDKDAGDIRRDPEAKNAIMLTWQISFDQIREARPSAANVLSLMSWCDRQAIPSSLLRAHETNQQMSGDHERDRQTEDDQHEPNTDNLDHDDEVDALSDSSDRDTEPSMDDVFDDDITMLEGYSFVSTTVDASTFEMHRLVQLATRKWLKLEGQQDRWKERFAHNLSLIFPAGRYENWDVCQSLYPQAKAVTDLKLKNRNALLHQALVMHNAGWYTRERGAFAESEELCERSMKIRTGHLGNDHADTLMSIFNLATTYGKQGRRGEAEELEVKVIEARKRLLGESHPDTLTGMHNLAITYRHQGRYDEAEELEVEAMQTQRASNSADAGKHAK